MSREAYRGDAFLIVRGASGLRGAAERSVFVFQCYLDDSGTSGLPIVTMAGFLAGMQHWEHMEPEFDALLNRYEVPVLHAKEFHETRPPFKGWRKIKKRTFVNELFNIAHGRMLGLSVTVRKSDIIGYKKDSGRLPTMSPLGICFASIMFKVVTDPRLTPATQKDGAAFLVESGNKNNSEIEQYFHKMTTQPAFKGSLRSISFIAKGSCRAIQVADFLAFHSRRHMFNHNRFAGKLSLPNNPILEIIEKHVPVWQWGGNGKVEVTDVKIDDVDNASDVLSLVKGPS